VITPELIALYPSVSDRVDNLYTVDPIDQQLEHDVRLCWAIVTNIPLDLEYPTAPLTHDHLSDLMLAMDIIVGPHL
jgi:hypothetical protein